MKDKKHFISVIVPIYQQARTIRQDLYSIYDTLEQIRYDYEIIAIVDGTSIDNSYQEAKKLKLKRLKVIGYPQNKGKGYAVRFGMAHTTGDYIAFIDSGMDIDPNGISMILEHMEWYQADIVVGSKRHPASQINYPLHRRIISFGAQLIAKYLLNINVTDTQVGLKIFRRPVLEKVLPRLLVKTFAFDLEILSVANRLGFSKIYEAPIKINFDFSGSHLQGKFFQTLLLCLKDSLAVFYRLRLLRYYDDTSRRRWKFDPQLKMRVNIG